MANKETFSLTFCEVAENHVGNQMIGTPVDMGYTNDELKELHARLTKQGAVTQLIELGGPTDASGTLLVIRNGVNFLIGEEKECPSPADAMWHEQKELTPRRDTKALMGRGSNKTVKNKNARHNLCFAEFDQASSYEEGKGTVVAFGDTIPITTKLREKMGSLILGKTSNLLAEGNYYYDVNKTYIGFHGDKERHRVICARLGETMPMCFQWFHRHDIVGPMIVVEVVHGDMYIMSEHTVGRNWMKSSLYTVRHAAGLLPTLRKTTGPKKVFEKQTKYIHYKASLLPSYMEDTSIPDLSSLTLEEKKD